MDATTSVASAFLSATVESLLHKLASPELIDYVKYSHLNVLKLTVLETKLLTLHSVLHDAEQKQFFNPEVKQWLDELYNVISTAEDLFDEIGYSYLQCKVENTQSQHDFEYNSEIAMICQKLQGFAEQIEILGLQSRKGRIALPFQVRKNKLISKVLLSYFIRSVRHGESLQLSLVKHYPDMEQTMCQSASLRKSESEACLGNPG
ncbi:hypothetical protein P8452_24633 [Trifolium repens]|nr:hypothetical protein P8452_24633 [Trifolium repens]